MALYDTTDKRAIRVAPQGDTGLFNGLVARYTTWQRARATARALKSLSPAQLADIGIEPGDIEGFADRLALGRR